MAAEKPCRPPREKQNRRAPTQSITDSRHTNSYSGPHLVAQGAAEDGRGIPEAVQLLVDQRVAVRQALQRTRQRLVKLEVDRERMLKEMAPRRLDELHAPQPPPGAPGTPRRSRSETWLRQTQHEGNAYLAVPKEAGGVHAGGQDAARRPGELVLERVVRRLRRGQAAAERLEADDLARSRPRPRSEGTSRCQWRTSGSAAPRAWTGPCRRGRGRRRSSPSPTGDQFRGPGRSRSSASRPPPPRCRIAVGHSPCLRK